MQLRYGSYTHPLGEPAVVISRETLESETGIPYAYRERWDIMGLIVGSTAAAINSSVSALRAAYAQHDRDVTLLLPNGSPSTHRIISAGTIGGVRVVRPPSFPVGTGPEGITKRTFAVSLEAMIPATATNVLLAFRETVTASGGGPRYGWLETKSGPPIQQQLRRATIWRAVQSGSAAGLFAYPAVPGPLWPAALAEEPEIQYDSPARRGSDFIEYRVSWSYRFEYSRPLRGRPHKTIF